jgi:hypothetical protein
LNQEDIIHLNRPTTSIEIKATIKSLQKKQSPEPTGYTAEFYQIFKEVLIATFLKLFLKQKKKEHCQNHSLKPVLLSSPNWMRTQQKRE